MFVAEMEGGAEGLKREIRAVLGEGGGGRWRVVGRESGRWCFGGGLWWGVEVVEGKRRTSCIVGRIYIIGKKKGGR